MDHAQTLQVAPRSRRSSSTLTRLVFELEVESFGQGFNRFRKTQVLLDLQKLDRIPSLRGAEAIIKPLVGINVKGGCLFLGEQTPPLPHRTRTLHVDIISTQQADIDVELQFLHGFSLDQWNNQFVNSPTGTSYPLYANTAIWRKPKVRH